MWHFVRPVFIRTNCNIFSNGHQLKALDRTFRFRTFKTGTAKPKQGFSKVKIALIAAASGITTGTVYSVYQTNQQRTALLNPVQEKTITILDKSPNVEITKKVRYPTDSSGLKIILFQYTTCPFCCKVRAFLDFYGISYDLVEVDSVFRQQLKWTDYKKVPIVLVKVNDKYIQLNDSSMIISVLTSYLNDKEVSIEEVSNYYPSMSYVDDDGKIKKEILNRYYLMFQRSIASESKNESLTQERKWRQWADEVLVHMLSPNVYRNTEEALQAFKWFSEVGEWEKNFNAVEAQLVVYIGALAMWMIGKRLKKRHHLKDDVRLSLYEETNKWLKEVKKKGNQFHGGKNPDLADLAVFGVLNSIEGCNAFKDLLFNTNLGNWYSAMKEQIGNQAGTPLLVHR
ncbi:prostaglandin E synthase 2 [Halyomorpha halys]|uniref:prostaglandin E synthase 2 n=1 Tax=Halyomorpha halys TaxID=286706 RepID=UPI0006D4FDA1|nr:prostaglandin E synthase 2 [Halyomorpha halys]